MEEAAAAAAAVLMLNSSFCALLDAAPEKSLPGGEEGCVELGVGSAALDDGGTLAVGRA